ncbi:DUF2059 domain-containing protein [Pseudoflavitalea sp. G-6-1-2]|uniref:DUF2059 domain-containing protein n=1 Tax=Pseudoflavitalea sp. G-6-1-2 TaxID=2728841 RepID=UPI00146F2BD4|nr:DUF2059 domain-containing protein [Pseudoflavitalea sp. G-6-1-2]NML21676.1 DUF2059 domain-containing protein [Pseudoflavitalea sp. G-6-1-2]
MKAKLVFMTALMAFGMITANAQQVDAAKKQKIEELFTVIEMEKNVEASVLLSADNTIASAPALSSKREEVRAFFRKYMGYSAVKEEMIKTYAKYYSTEELAELVRFHKTPAGKKFTATSGSIAQDLTTINSMQLNQHGEELKKIFDSATASK